MAVDKAIKLEAELESATSQVCGFVFVPPLSFFIFCVVGETKISGRRKTHGHLCWEAATSRVGGNSSTST